MKDSGADKVGIMMGAAKARWSLPWDATPAELQY
jgi:hypothetical protein